MKANWRRRRAGEPPKSAAAETDGASPAADRGAQGPVTARRPARRRWRRVGVAFGVLALVVAAAVSVDAAWLTTRLDRVPIPATTAPVSGETWVIIGSDSRAAKPDGPDHYGDTSVYGGQRSDVIVVVQVIDGHGRGFSIPRDLVVKRAGEDRRERITLALQNGGAAELVGALCVGLGVPTDHFVQVTMRSFVETVDALGGVDVEFDHPTRDEYYLVAVDEAGVKHFGGVEALKLVRSRHPEYLIDGTWQAADPSQGNLARASHAAAVLEAISAKARSALLNPIRLQRAAAAISDGVTLDQETALWALPPLAKALRGGIEVLPVQATGTELAMMPNAQTYERLAEFGYVPGQCAVALDPTQPEEETEPDPGPPSGWVRRQP